MALLVNKKHVRDYALACAKAGRPRFERVGKELYVVLDSKMRSWIAEYIHRLPSVGKTIK